MRQAASQGLLAGRWRCARGWVTVSRPRSPRAEGIVTECNTVVHAVERQPSQRLKYRSRHWRRILRQSDRSGKRKRRDRTVLTVTFFQRICRSVVKVEWHTHTGASINVQTVTHRNIRISSRRVRLEEQSKEKSCQWHSARVHHAAAL